LIIFQNWQQLQDNTTWMRKPMEILPMIAIWLYSISTIFIESPLYKSPDLIIITRLIIDFSLLILVFFSVYFLCINTPKRIWLFVLIQIFLPLIFTRGLDLSLGNRVSIAIRYMMPSYLGIQIAIAYLLSHKINLTRSISSQQKLIWKSIFSLVILIGIFSCIFMLDKSPQYQKNRNLYNPEIATIINQSNSPILLAQSKDVLDVISLSYLLNSQTRVQFFSTPELDELPFLKQCNNVFLLNLSLTAKDEIQNNNHQIEFKQVYQPKLLSNEEIHLSLWLVQKAYNNCS
jgi:uncharacterized membrane protein